MAKKQIEVLGSDELKYIFKEMGTHLERKVMQSALQIAAKPLLKAAKAKVPTNSGELAKSIVIFPLRKAKKAGVIVGPEVKKGSAGWRAHFVEYGTAGKELKQVVQANPNNRKRKNARKKIGKFKIIANGVTTYTNKISGQTAQPFMRPAYAATENEMIENFGKSMTIAITRFAKRYEKKNLKMQ